MPTGLRRYYGKGDLHFITFSCYKRLPLLKSARARDVFVRELARVRDELGFGLMGYVVMPEHVHFLMSEPPRGTPSTVLQKLKLRVARKMRERRKSAPPGQMRLPFEECRSDRAKRGCRPGDGCRVHENGDERTGFASKLQKLMDRLLS